jgi:hypothetical protein
MNGHSMNFVTPAGVRAIDDATRQEISFVLPGGMPAARQGPHRVIIIPFLQ